MPVEVSRVLVTVQDCLHWFCCEDVCELLDQQGYFVASVSEDVDVFGDACFPVVMINLLLGLSAFYEADFNEVFDCLVEDVIVDVDANDYLVLRGGDSNFGEVVEDIAFDA